MAQDANLNDEKKSFKDSLNLPRTEFPIRANSKIDDPALIKRWQDDNLYEKSFNHNTGKTKFILHDGPPYANGDIHLGHAYNKILKDIIAKSKRMTGLHVPVTPGWDCHGLPIEKGVAEKNPDLSKIELMNACRNYANHWINVQRESFKSLGILMDWQNPYITMSPEYEAATVRAFGKFVHDGFIERKNKTVPWCFNCKTVLASAEIEHKDRKDPSIYTLFGLDKDDAKRLFPEINKEINILVWTTTPWTLPLNMAVMANPNAKYALLDINGQYIIVGSGVADKICALVQAEKNVIREFVATYLKDIKIDHPFVAKQVPLVFDDSVGTDEGTAFVHCAPGCGPIDYEVGVKNNLEIYSPISDSGTYTDQIEPKELLGMPVVDGQIWVIKKLAELNKIFFKNNINHSYPHCWRCRNGLIFRATPQWFFDLNKEGIKNKALDAIEKINFIPSKGKGFLKATVGSRWEWCLSRQRAWGSPIPALLCKKCDYTHLDENLIEKVAKGISTEGIEYWQKVEIKDLVQNLNCPNCGCQDLIKEENILDVWFDSGISHYAVLYNNPKLHFPADIYVEGLDQHRGWFQSSLLTSLVLEHTAAMKSIMTHGFTVDAKGQKMSKSLGNVVSPKEIIDKLGTDGLRLWVASVGSDSDPVVSEQVFQNISEVYRKIRNTCRFLLSNLYDFDSSKDMVSFDLLDPIDKYALSEINKLNAKILADYTKLDFTAVFHEVSQYCVVELSSFYLDIIKDRLYADKADSISRRSAQTVSYIILDIITRLMAPVMSFTSELVSDNYQNNKKESIHLQSFPDIVSYQTTNGWDILKEVRSVILKHIEVEREKGLIKHSLEAKVRLFIDLDQEIYLPLKELFESIKKQNMTLDNFFKEYVIVSQFELLDNKSDLATSSSKNIYVSVLQASGTKCPRCWKWDQTSNTDGLCSRCQIVLDI